MSNKKYRVRPPVEIKRDKAKNAVIIILCILLIFSVICIFVSVDITYDPAYDAVRENTELKQRVDELNREVERLNGELEKSKTQTVSGDNDYTVAPPNQHVEGYDEYRKNMETDAEDSMGETE